MFRPSIETWFADFVDRIWHQRYANSGGTQRGFTSICSKKFFDSSNDGIWKLVLQIKRALQFYGLASTKFEEDQVDEADVTHDCPGSAPCCSTTATISFVTINDGTRYPSAANFKFHYRTLVSSPTEASNLYLFFSNRITKRTHAIYYATCS